jgi:glycosyltransferase involved in cell wall biosynthesis
MPGQIPRYEVPWLLHHVNCALVPSRAETFGHNFIEPMFASLPVVGTRVGIGREVILDGETGFGFSLKNPKEFSSAVQILAENPELAKDMGRRAHELVSKRFRHSDVAKLIVDVYRKLMNE